MSKINQAALLSILTFIFSIANLEASKGSTEAPYHSKQMREKCHGQPENVYKFGALLKRSNQKKFCAVFDDAQKKQAMQLAGQKDLFGNPELTPDQAVEKVAAENNL